MSKKQRTYSGVTPTVYDDMKAALQAGGAVMRGHTKGAITMCPSGFKFEFEYEWDGKDEIVVVCVKKPFVVGWKKMWAKIDEVTREAGVTTTEEV